MKLEELKTPALGVDLPKLKSNIRSMKERAGLHGVRLRPHAKTHKTVEIARMQIPENAAGITVSTMAETRFYHNAGFDDITYAFPITPNHSCLTAALFPEYRVVEKNRVVDEWRPMRGW